MKYFYTSEFYKNNLNKKSLGMNNLPTKKNVDIPPLSLDLVKNTNNLPIKINSINQKSTNKEFNQSK